MLMEVLGVNVVRGGGHIRRQQQQPWSGTLICRLWVRAKSAEDIMSVGGVIGPHGSEWETSSMPRVLETFIYPNLNIWTTSTACLGGILGGVISTSKVTYRGEVWRVPRNASFFRVEDQVSVVWVGRKRYRWDFVPYDRGAIVDGRNIGFGVREVRGNRKLGIVGTGHRSSEKQAVKRKRKKTKKSLGTPPQSPPSRTKSQ
ncbi:hypothetical protein BDZ94DRAFT_1301628 [Collybia nuda]|uniref:Uncharacterized protein n=1 Tax=Collybia nuda TaxID=64659 RepID=A0A9P5XW68_9AGAR|nr:hypothetical protein BDZ94DRAFT_1301628 [Collybia nuda]